MAGATKTLVIAFFPRKFCGEAAQFELGLHRVEAMQSGGWGVEWVELDDADPTASVRRVEESSADLVLLHANRTQMTETVAFVDAMAASSPDRPLVLCGWVAQPSYAPAP
jgi:hypothetical protein